MEQQNEILENFKIMIENKPEQDVFRAKIAKELNTADFKIDGWEKHYDDKNKEIKTKQSRYKLITNLY